MPAHGDSGDWPLDPHLHPDVVAVVALVALGYKLALTRTELRSPPPTMDRLGRTPGDEHAAALRR